MKKRIINVKDIPTEETHKYKAATTQNTIYEFIKKHPNCTRRDIYSLHFNEGDIRKTLLTMLKSHKIKETFTIR